MSIYKDVSIILVTYIPNLDLLKNKIQIFKNFKIIIIDTSPKKYKIKKS